MADEDDEIKDPRKKPFYHTNPRTGEAEQFAIDHPSLPGRIMEQARVGYKEYGDLEAARLAERKKRGLE